MLERCIRNLFLFFAALYATSNKPVAVKSASKPQRTPRHVTKNVVLGKNIIPTRFDS